MPNRRCAHAELLAEGQCPPPGGAARAPSPTASRPHQPTKANRRGGRHGSHPSPPRTASPSRIPRPLLSPTPGSRRFAPLAPAAHARTMPYGSPVSTPHGRRVKLNLQADPPGTEIPRRQRPLTAVRSPQPSLRVAVVYPDSDLATAILATVRFVNPCLLRPLVTAGGYAVAPPDALRLVRLQCRCGLPTAWARPGTGDAVRVPPGGGRPQPGLARVAQPRFW